MAVRIVQFEWGGKKFGYEIKTECAECNLTTSILKNMMKKEFKGRDVSFEVKPWLDNFFYCLFRGAWHAPIIMVNGRKFYQFSEEEPLFDRKELVRVVEQALKR